MTGACCSRPLSAASSRECPTAGLNWIASVNGTHTAAPEHARLSPRRAIWERTRDWHTATRGILSRKRGERPSAEPCSFVRNEGETARPQPGVPRRAGKEAQSVPARVGRSASTANRDRRSAQGHQPLNVRSEDRARYTFGGPPRKAASRT